MSPVHPWVLTAAGFPDADYFQCEARRDDADGWLVRCSRAAVVSTWEPGGGSLRYCAEHAAEDFNAPLGAS